MAKSVKDMVNIILMVPDEPLDAWVARQGFITPIWGFRVESETLNHDTVTQKTVPMFGYFGKKSLKQIRENA